MGERTDWAAVKEADIRRWVAAAARDGLSPASLARRLSAWRGFFDALAEDVVHARGNLVEGAVTLRLFESREQILLRADHVREGFVFRRELARDGIQLRHTGGGQLPAVQIAREDFVRRLRDGVTALLVEPPERRVGKRRRLLQDGKGADDLLRHLLRADGEILEAPLRLRPPIAILRHANLSERIMLDLVLHKRLLLHLQAERKASDKFRRFQCNIYENIFQR